MNWWRRAVASAVLGGVCLSGTVDGPVARAAPVVDEAAVRQAKVGLAWFLFGNVDRPRNVADACPLLSQPSVGDYLGHLGLASSERPFGVEVVFDTRPGGGVVAARCGVDVAASADPEGSTALALDGLILDGQATFAQHAVRLFSRDVIVNAVTEPGPGQLASVCTNGGRACTAALNLHGLVLVARLSGLPADTGERQARQLVVLVASEVVASLGAVPAPT